MPWKHWFLVKIVYLHSHCQCYQMNISIQTNLMHGKNVAEVKIGNAFQFHLTNKYKPSWIIVVHAAEVVLEIRVALPLMPLGLISLPFSMDQDCTLDPKMILLGPLLQSIKLFGSAAKWPSHLEVWTRAGRRLNPFVKKSFSSKATFKRFGYLIIY